MMAHMLKSWFKTFDSEQNHRKHGKMKTSFLKEIVEIADPQKPVLNKIMTTQE